MYTHEQLIEVSFWNLSVAVLPLFIIAYSSWYLEIGIENPILIGIFRTFIQLSILSIILDPIFELGYERWGLVLAYILFMITLSAFEAKSRSKYFFKDMFWYVLVLILVNVTITSLYAFGLVLHLDPLWDPQYVIPIVGMLLGNIINGVSLSINTMLISIVESSREIEVMLSFGASPYEASLRLLKEAVRTGSMPQLNSMVIIGLISIPGMMTGQILGGNSVTQAARYQILITYFIACCSLGSILMEVLFIVRVCFDSKTMLRTDKLYERKERKSLLASGRNCSSLFGVFRRAQRKEDTSFSTDETAFLAPSGELSVRTSPIYKRNGNGSDSEILSVSGLSFAFKKGSTNGETHSFSTINKRILFQNASFRARSNERILVDGPSGVGKSTLLRIIAGLIPFDAGEITLCGKSISYFKDMAVWRKQVLYVPQTKIDFPGSPRSLIHQITTFRVWKGDKIASPSRSKILEDIEELMVEWGIARQTLDSEWKTLSGGESQRMFLSISLASRPKVILLDECTSAVDLTTKVKVEKSIEGFCKRHGMCSIWVTHDHAQQDRMQMVSNGNGNSPHV